MPICQMKTNYKMDEQIRKAFLSKTADLMAEILEKIIDYKKRITTIRKSKD